MLNKPSKGDEVEFPEDKPPTLGMTTSRLATGGEGGEVTFPIKKGKRALDNKNACMREKR
jgi:hypothetical protein